MNYPVLHPWKGEGGPDVEERLESVFAAVVSPVSLFFRVDDVGVPSAAFARLVELFARHDAPLAMAVVPTWLTERRWAELRPLLAPRADLWTLHQHGRRHVNHEPPGLEPSGKPRRKCEFGSGRPAEEKRRDLVLGRRRLERIMGDAFTPVFTPPWNRMDAEALEAARELGYAAVSRTVGAKPAAPSGLPDIPVRLDLHTRKEPSADAALDGLLRDLAEGLTASAAAGPSCGPSAGNTGGPSGDPTGAVGRTGGGPCGIMIHYQRMNGRAFAFLDALLRAARRPLVRVEPITAFIGSNGA